MVDTDTIVLLSLLAEHAFFYLSLLLTSHYNWQKISRAEEKRPEMNEVTRTQKKEKELFA